MTSLRAFPLSRRLALFLLALVTFAAPVSAEQLYTCGMHPQVIKKEPGDCPICGMKLTPILATSPGAHAAHEIKFYKSTMIPGEVKSGPGKDSMGMEMTPVYADESDAPSLQIDSATVQRMNLQTGLVERGPVRRDFRTVGIVAFNESSLRDVTTKFEGWIDQLYVSTTWSPVKAGDPLFAMYSPELYSAELNFIAALKSGEGESTNLYRAALTRLQLFDVSAEDIAELKKTGEAARHIVVRAPMDGVVIEKMGVVGQMMKPGERIYRLADVSTVWIEAQIYEKDLPFVQAGQTAAVRTSYGPDRTYSGEIQALLPKVQEESRTVTARIVLKNADGFLRPGMYVDVSLSAQIADHAVLVPDSAVLRSGERNTVFLALDNGYFEPREIGLGARSNGNFYQVLSGLSGGERVVISGQFMLDSESQLRDAIQKMLKPVTAEAPAHPAVSAANAAPAASISSADPAPPLALRALCLAAADAADALASDDLDRYKQQLRLLRSAVDNCLQEAAEVSKPLAPFRSSLADPADLHAARRQFEPFSTAVADLVRAQRLLLSEKLHVFECPMAPVTGKGRWLQRDSTTKNPFYGSEMPGCGSEIAGPGDRPVHST